MKKRVKQILFICKHNRFRSKVAEALFKKYNKNKKIKVKSAGTSPDYILVAKNVTKVLKVLGANKINRKPKKINQELIDDSDLIVIVANNINKKELGDIKGKKIIIWKIKDTSQHDYLGILKRANLIEKRIKKLVSMLKCARIA